MPSLIDVGNARWYRFLSRWSLLAGLVYVGLFSAFFMVMTASQNSSLPPEYAGFEFFDLAAALQSPALYRVVITLDVAAWLALGGFFIALAAIFAHRAPIRSTFIGALGISQVVGYTGAYTRFGGVSDLAARYATAAPEQQETLIRSYLDIVLIFTSHFGAGALLWSTALVLAASVAWSLAEFPRWLAIGLALPGIMMLIQQVVGLLTGMDLGFLFFPAIIVLIVIFYALAWRFWRRTPALAPETRGALAS